MKSKTQGRFVQQLARADIHRSETHHLWLFTEMVLKVFILELTLLKTRELQNIMADDPYVLWTNDFNQKWTNMTAKVKCFQCDMTSAEPKNRIDNYSKREKKICQSSKGETTQRNVVYGEGHNVGILSKSQWSVFPQHPDTHWKTTDGLQTTHWGPVMCKNIHLLFKLTSAQ